MADPLTTLANGRFGRAYRRLVAIALAPFYAFYTQRLRAAVLLRPRPGHIAVIMDGNRRWATSAGFADPGEGHRRGAEKALELIDWCVELGIREVTLWALSVENLERATSEMCTITDVAVEASPCSAPADVVPARRSTCMSSVGGSRCPRGCVEGGGRSATLSHADGAMDVTVAIAYSGRDELLEAFRATVRELSPRASPAADLVGGIDCRCRRGAPVHGRRSRIPT